MQYQIRLCNSENYFQELQNSVVIKKVIWEVWDDINVSFLDIFPNCYALFNCYLFIDYENTYLPIIFKSFFLQIKPPSKINNAV